LKNRKHPPEMDATKIPDIDNIGTTTTETAVIAVKLFSKTYTIDQSTNAP
jgi:hypothetical protein